MPHLFINNIVKYYYNLKNSHTHYIYSGVKKCWPPSWFFIFLHVCHTLMFQIIKQIKKLIKDNTSKHNMQFLNEGFFLWRENKIQTHMDLCEKVFAPTPC